MRCPNCDTTLDGYVCDGCWSVVVTTPRGKPRLATRQEVADLVCANPGVALRLATRLGRG